MRDRLLYGRSSVLALALAVLAGCLPSSQRHNDRSISAADSASTRRAAEAPVDTLEAVWTAQAPEDAPMPFPTTLGWLGDGSLAVAETQAGSVRQFSGDGAYLGAADAGGEGAFPYLAGVRGDTALVLARGRDALLWVLPGAGVVRSLAVPDGATAALASGPRLAVRRGGGASEEAPEVVVLSEQGEIVGRHAITGAAWRAGGFLRTWGDSLLALSGYRPVVDVLPPGAPARVPLDTLALDGFASPQFVRSAQFVRGEADEPPLLTSSAAPLGERLFVLNLRDDHVRIDVYGRGGEIQHVLVSPRPWAPTDVVPYDLAARPGPGDAVDLAVLMARPAGVLQAPAHRIVLYRWRPSPAGAAPADAAGADEAGADEAA